MPFLRKSSPPPPPLLAEIVTPRINAAPLAAMQTGLAGIALTESVSLEMWGTGKARWFLARAHSPLAHEHLTGALGAAYPQAEVRLLDLTQRPLLDPASPRPDEGVRACELVLDEPPYLPLRVFEDGRGDGPGGVDPLVGVLAALGGLPDGWRAVSQLVLAPAPETWAAPYKTLALTPPPAVQARHQQADTSLTPVFLLAGVMLLVALGVWVYQQVLDGAWLPLAGAALAVALLVWPAVRLARRLLHKPVYDPQLVQDKIAYPAFRCQLRLAVFAPKDAPRQQVEAHLTRLVAAYRPFHRPSGNRFQARWLPDGDLRLDQARFIGSSSAHTLLNVRELAGLWHIPRVETETPLVERTAARRWLPLPYPVSHGCPVGRSTHQGRSVPVALPDDLLQRHLLLVAKTRRGKSSLLLQVARYLMTQTTPSVPHTLVLVDPHRDLALAALGLVPPDRHDRVVYLDVAERRRPFGLNLLDVGLGWDRDEAVGNVLRVFRREFDRFWGPRMEDAFRFALLTLYAANETLVRVDPLGRARQYTVLDAPTLLVDDPFRRHVLELADDPILSAWWQTYFESLDPRLRTEIINPVQTKVQRFVGSRVARLIVGQPVSTIDPAAWLRDGAIVIVNTGKGVVGEDTAALIGGTLLNLLSLAIGAQAALPPSARRHATLIVDEFHTLRSADYEAILSEQAKYGANLVLATQSLARLEANSQEGGPSLRAVLFANLDGLFAFQTSAEDAEYLAAELGSGVEVEDLIGLPHFTCYAALTLDGERLPPFSLRLDEPPAADQSLAQTLAAHSAHRYGRSALSIEQELLGRLQAQRVAREAEAKTVHPKGQGQGIPDQKGQPSVPAPTEANKTSKGGGAPKKGPARNDHRPRKGESGQRQAGLGWTEAPGEDREAPPPSTQACDEVEGQGGSE